MLSCNIIGENIFLASTSIRAKKIYITALKINFKTKHQSEKYKLIRQIRFGIKKLSLNRSV